MHNPPTHQPRASKSLRSLLAQSVCLVGDGSQPQNQPPTLALGSGGRKEKKTCTTHQPTNPGLLNL